MNILITGSNGFIGKNLKLYLKDNTNYNIFEFNKNDDLSLIDFRKIDFIVHLAAVHRSNNLNDFKKYNINFTEDLINACSDTKTPIIYSSSIQADLDTPYGKSKLACENLIKDYSLISEHCKIFRLTNTFGELSNPNYLSVVSTFCYNVSHGLKITINDLSSTFNFTYIKDVVKNITNSLNYNINHNILSVEPQYQLSLSDLYELISNIHFKRNNDSFDSDLVIKMKDTYNYFKGLP